jgi:hypothetical protein
MTKMMLEQDYHLSFFVIILVLLYGSLALLWNALQIIKKVFGNKKILSFIMDSGQSHVIRIVYLPFFPLSLAHLTSLSLILCLFLTDFGEITLWFGIFLSASSGYSRINQWLSICSPLFVAFLLIYISGIPLLEKLADEKYKDNKEYKLYKQSVPVLIPFIGRAGNSKF